MALHDYREDTEATVDTWEVLDQQGAEAPGNFVVPPGAKAITELFLGAAPDAGAAAAVVPVATAFRIQGPALKIDTKPMHFVGPCGFLRVDTAGFSDVYSMPSKVPVNIPVQEGQEFDIAGKMVGTDLGDCHFLAGVTYDGPVAMPTLKAAEVRTGDVAAANTLVVIGTDVAEGLAVQSYFPPPGVTRILAADVGVGMTPVADNATRFAHQVELDGNGLSVAIKPQRWFTWCGASFGVTSGGGGILAPPERKILDLPVTVGRGNPIIARSCMLEDDYGDGHVMVGLLYV